MPLSSGSLPVSSILGQNSALPWEASLHKNSHLCTYIIQRNMGDSFELWLGMYYL